MQIDKCLTSAFKVKGTSNIQPESHSNVPSSNMQGLLTYKREIAAELKMIQTLVYNCNSMNTLLTTKEKLSAVKSTLYKTVPREGALPIRQALRKLPGRKRYIKINGKYQRRVGKGAQIMKESISTGKICYYCTVIYLGGHKLLQYWHYLIFFNGKDVG